MARESKYDKVIKPYIPQITRWRREGAKLDWIAEQFPVNRGTFFNYKSKYPELAAALAEAEEEFLIDLSVTAENSLADKLIDRMEIVEETREVWKDKDGKISKEHTFTRRKLIPADTTAIIFALKNNMPGRWNTDEHELIRARKKKVEVETSRIEKGEDVGQMVIDKLNRYMG